MIRTGIDIVETERFERLVRHQGDRFLDRCFTAGERTECERKNGKIRHYAGNFAAKEAVFKALRLKWRGAFSWKDIEIGRREAAPYVRFGGRLALLKDRYEIDISISHCSAYSVAIAVLEEKFQSASFEGELNLH